jgi:hypothetical protein
MAFNNTQLKMLNSAIDGTGAEWVYTTTDSMATCSGAGYFYGAGFLGLEIGDRIFIRVVNSVSAPATVSAADFRVVTAVDALTGDVTAGIALAGSSLAGAAADYISTENTYIVAASGGDFTDIQTGVDFLNGKILNPAVGQTFLISDGTYTIGSYVRKEGSFGQNTWIKGANTYARNVTSIASSSGSSGAWSIVLNMNSVANIAVNDYIAFVAPSGGTLPTYLAGCHKVTNVGASTITISSSHHATTAPSGAVTAAGTVLKSVLYFPNSDGFQIWSGNATLNFQDVVIVGGATGNGISLQDGGGRVYIAGTVAVVGFYFGVYGTYNVEINGDGILISSGAANIAFNADNGSFMTATPLIASGAGAYGLVASNGGIIVANSSIVTGNTLDGVLASNGGTIRLGSTSVTGNGRWGVNSDTISFISVDTVTASNNVRGDYASRGLTGLDGNSIFTDQSYGANGTATPDGHNTFIGWGAGSANCGSTATATNEGSANVGIGQYATNSMTKGYMNAAVGYAALSSITTGYNNVGVGQKAGQKITGGSTNNVTSYNSTYLGALTRASADGNTNETVIGYGTTGSGSNTTTIGNSSTTLTKLAGAVSSTAYTVATLPSASTSGAGARAFVTDANATMTAGIGTTVAAGGANAVPVYSDGTNWKIG